MKVFEVAALVRVVAEVRADSEDEATDKFNSLVWERLGDETFSFANIDSIEVMEQ